MTGSPYHLFFSEVGFKKIHGFDSFSPPGGCLVMFQKVDINMESNGNFYEGTRTPRFPNATTLFLPRTPPSPGP